MDMAIIFNNIIFHIPVLSRFQLHRWSEILMNSKPVTLTIQVFIPMLEKAYLLSVICQKVKLVKVIANSKTLKIIFLNTVVIR